METMTRDRWFRTLAVVLAMMTLAAGCGCAAAPPRAQPRGSGCSGLGASLGPGEWFGSVTPASTASSLKVDVVCFFVEDAELAAAEDGVNPTGVYNEYIRNQSARLRDVPVCTDATAHMVYKPEFPNTRAVSVEDLLGYADGSLTNSKFQTFGGGLALARLTIPSGSTCVGTLTQQYLP